MSLALDYRPQDLDGFEGNVEIKKSLGSILKRPRKELPHCWLFTGLSGGGKTTLAGIVANHLKCHAHELYELNSATFRKIENARELERVIRYKPMHGEVRVWIFNEVHKWLDDTQNAMLDIMEKLPDHVYFLLTTTDPQKLLPALKGRCVPYEVKPLTDDEMLDFLDYIVKEEKAAVPDRVLENICNASGGSSRNALQYLEKVVKLNPKDMEKVSFEMEETEATTKQLIDVLLKRKPWKDVAKILKNVTEEQETLRISIRNYCTAILLNGTDNKQAALIISCLDKPMYETGKASITTACYDIICG